MNDKYESQPMRADQPPTEPRRRSFYQFKAVHVVYYILGVVEVLLAFRLVFHIFGANVAAPFVAFIYSVSDIFMSPFNTIFPTFSSGIAVFEWPVLVAMAVYAIITLGVVKLINLIIGRTPREET